MQINHSTPQSATLRQSYQAKAEKTDEPNKEAAKQNINVFDVDQQREIQKLKNRDREVRLHEQAHLSAAGGIATGGASFQFVIGPDGHRYAVGGEVGIDTSPIPDNPEATLRKAETIRRAALAPAQPSAQDYSVASKATAMARQASVELINTQQDPVRRGSKLDVRV